jgi:hypothetical protein
LGGVREKFVKNRRITVALLAAVVLIVSPPALAHHGNAAYDDRNPVTLIGIVTEFSWTNPHSLIYFDVKDAKGKIVHWTCETHSPGVLKRNGWNEDSLKPGDEITIILDASRNGDPLGWSGAARRHSVRVANGPLLTFDKSQD